MPPRTDNQQPRSGLRFTPEFWAAVIVAVVTVGTPALIWAGKTDQRVENLERNRNEMREDLREINRKLDAVLERIK